ncbi:putative F-box domain, leucine-rich repeat domain superfamily, F-box-like domain superfamily [Helianthus anomalus]
MDVEEDRLSSLPNYIVHKILSFLDITDVIGTSILSSRWRSIWTSMPYLKFTSQDFPKYLKFSKFVTHVLSRRNSLTQVYSLKLTFRGKATQAVVRRILNYAFSRNIQQLDVVCLLENDIEFPLSLFTSQSLKHLSLTMQSDRSCGYRFYNSYLSLTWELPSLTTLDLHSVTLRDDINVGIGFLSKCANLKNLTLRHIKTTGSNGLSICHPQLSNITLEDTHYYKVKVVTVVAPQLQNLTIRSNNALHVVLSTPHLTSLFYKGSRPLRLSTDGLHSLEKANICVSSPEDANAHQIVCLLQQLHNVHSLTLNLEIAEVLYNCILQ